LTTLQTKITIPPDVLFREVSGEAVILNVANGKYYGLDNVGTRMWALLAEHLRLEPVHQALLEEYEVQPEILQADLIRLVDELAAQGLVTLDAG
jgi:hypothetical protein